MEADLTFMCDRFAPIGSAVYTQHSPIVKKVSYVDSYTDESGKSITVRIHFSDKSKTLTREEVSAVTDKVVAKLAEQGIALKS